MKLHQITLFILVASILTSCEKKLENYENDPRLYFFEQEPTPAKALIVSRALSFATKPAALMQDTVYVKVKTMGLTATVNRTFGVEAVIKGTTGTVGGDYKILKGTVKANQTDGSVGIVVYRTPELKTVTKSLIIKIADVDDFKSGTVENNVFTISWNDALLKPENWETRSGLKTFFGAYSDVKYQFIIDVLGISVFPLTAAVPGDKFYSYYDMQDKRVQVKEALKVYNATHAAPLTDEFGVVITIP